MAQKELDDLMPISYNNINYRQSFPRDKHFSCKITPIVAKTVHLCGYGLNFSKVKHPDTGKMVNAIYTLDSRKFPPRNIEPGATKSKQLSVLPEILEKLTNPVQPAVIVSELTITAQATRPKVNKPKVNKFKKE